MTWSLPNKKWFTREDYFIDQNEKITLHQRQMGSLPGLLQGDEYFFLPSLDRMLLFYR